MAKACYHVEATDRLWTGLAPEAVALAIKSRLHALLKINGLKMCRKMSELLRRAEPKLLKQRFVVKFSI